MRLSPGCQCCYPPCPPNRLACLRAGAEPPAERARTLTATISGVAGSAYSAALCDSVFAEGSLTLYPSLGGCIWTASWAISQYWYYEHNTAYFCAGPSPAPSCVDGAYIRCWIPLTVQLTAWVQSQRMEARYAFFLGPYPSCTSLTTVKMPNGTTGSGFTLATSPAGFASVDAADPLTCTDLEAGITLTHDGDVGDNPACDITGATIVLDLDP